jgi:bacteriocin-like protein
MTLPINDDFAMSELSTCELETVSGGIYFADGGHGGGNGHHHGHQPLDIAALLSQVLRQTIPFMGGIL